jgi:hypothetical protein
MSPSAAPDALWEGRARAPWAVPAFLAFVVAGIALGVVTHWAFGLVVALSGLFTLALVEVRAQVTPTALRIRYSGPLGFPTQTLPLDRVATVEAIDVDPKRYGGWGYRGSLKLYRRAALNLRRGPGLRVELADGRTFVLTIDDAAGAVAALHPHIDARPTRPARP